MTPGSLSRDIVWGSSKKTFSVSANAVLIVSQQKPQSSSASPVLNSGNSLGSNGGSLSAAVLPDSVTIKTEVDSEETQPPVAAENAQSNGSNPETALQTTLGARESQSNGVVQVATETSVAPSSEPSLVFTATEPISNDVQPTIPKQVLIPILIAAKPEEIAQNDHNKLSYPF